MKRFKVSKFKNAATKLPKKEDYINSGCICDGGGVITAGAELLAFASDSRAGVVSIYPINPRTPRPLQPNILPAHSEVVTALSFSPFSDWLLATGSHDGSVKVWQLPEDGSTDTVVQPEIHLPMEEKSVTNIIFHPAAGQVLATSMNNHVKVWDITKQEATFDLSGHGDTVQDIDWSVDGAYLASTCRDKQLRVWDPRANVVTHSSEAHRNPKGSSVCWLADDTRLLTTGFDATHQSQVYLWDLRRFDSSVTSLSLGRTGLMFPMFDADTNMLFLAGKGEPCVGFYEVQDKEPFLTEASAFASDVQIVSICKVPKRGLNVMQGEVNRLLMLSQRAVVPVSYVVPRKSYRDFHEDLYPMTAWSDPALTAEQWFAGGNDRVKKCSLNPTKRPAKTYKASPFHEAGEIEPVIATEHSKAESSSEDTPTEVMTKVTEVTTKVPPGGAGSMAHEHTPPNDDTVQHQPQAIKPSAGTGDDAVITGAARLGGQGDVHARDEPQSHPTAGWAGVRASKFKNLHVVVAHRREHVENLRGVDGTVGGESAGFAANTSRAAVALAGPGGTIAVLELSRPGRLPDTGVPVVENGSAVMDLAWDPFNNARLAVACDDAKIRIWSLPEEGLTEMLTEPECYLKGHTEKIYLLAWHTTASDILASASYDMTVRIWNVCTMQEVISLDGHTDQVYSFAWSPDGKYSATLCKDQKLRIYNPRSSTEPIQESLDEEGIRKGKVIWVMDGWYLLATGFSRTSERQVYIYSVEDISAPLTTVGLDFSPSILTPYYDADSASVFLTGKGDTTIFAYEVAADAPYLFPLAGYTGSTLHQGLAFLPKTACDVMKIEFARALKLTQNSIEPMLFTVPRTQMQYFQDDLFPETRVWWEPLQTAEEWLGRGKQKPHRKINLQPPGSKALSEAPKPSIARKPKYDSGQELAKTAAEKKEELIQAMHEKLQFQDDVLPQDECQGADSDEWSD
ncbi:PREDICTED: coronin-7-like [Priapulus caudatus]|uniref:Coronin n=1 Tax=Priapulus caudatus TaxID=37621 RepID=A0ABM1FBD7_PRICU|nr:PREDICTED: coronin-7-like [Priapulus caudatus]